MNTIELVLDLDKADDKALHRQMAAEHFGVPLTQIVAVQVRKRSLDARGKSIKVRLQVEVYINEPVPDEEMPQPVYPRVSGPRAVVIVGCGPAGMFAALRLIELGIKPIILERGKDVQARRRDLAAINRQGIVNAESNYCFGEGGAGTYSDGKLYTRATKRGNVEGILKTLVAHGAPPEILVDAHPHIGSNKLPKVVQAMRRSIIEAGGEIRFQTRMVDFLIEENGEEKRIVGAVTADGAEVRGEAVILATGHSARDIFNICHARAIRLEAKSFAMGVRIEHPQPLIDLMQYRQEARDERLPAASYRLASTVQERGVFSFCMCPGGWIVPAATDGDEVVVNGMSLSRRDSPFANSGLVVGIELQDTKPFGDDVLAGVRYQKSLEIMACEAGGGAQRAPGQRVTDFLASRTSSSLPACSYRPGLQAAPLHELLPPPLAQRLQSGLRDFEKTKPGYVSEEAVIVGVETRTSSPVRLPRDSDTLQHLEIHRLYPCGEGAGYAGGIVSAAIDGVRVAEAIAKNQKS